MKYLITILLLAFFSSVCVSEPALVGTWKSDKDRTLDFIKSYAKVNDNTEEFLSQVMGHLTLRFDGKTVHLRTPDQTLSISGESHDWEGMDETTEYNVVFRNENTVAITSYDKLIKKETIAVYHFIDQDLMWVYVSGFDAGLSDMHYREYFKRVK